MCLKVPRLSFGQSFMLVAVDLPWELSWRLKNQVFGTLQPSPSHPQGTRAETPGDA